LPQGRTRGWASVSKRENPFSGGTSRPHGRKAKRNGSHYTFNVSGHAGVWGYILDLYQTQQGRRAKKKGGKNLRNVLWSRLAERLLSRGEL